MRHGSLFSGIGGFDLAAEWMGWDNIFHCEWNPFAQKVLKHYWPQAKSYHDITKTDFTIHRGEIDILTGGFPCQPYSFAGKRLGKADDRHLWPEMLRAIREIKPKWVIGENVYGLVNWSEGLVFDEVQSELEAEGFEVFPYVLPAASVNAPHKRDRVWFVANAKGARAGENIGGVWGEFDRCGEGIQETRIATNSSSNGYDAKSTETNNPIGKDNQQSGAQRECAAEGFGNEWVAANSYGKRIKECDVPSEPIGKVESYWAHYENRGNWESFPTVPPVCIGDDGLSGRLDSITFSKWRNESIKAAGNAVLPQLILQIFKTVELYDRESKA